MRKRTFKQIREKILKILDKPKSTRQIAKDISAEWRTAKKQLMWLKAEENVVIYKKTDKEIIWKKS